MLTRQQVLEQWEGRDRGALGLFDPRDAVRIVCFFPVSDWAAFGMKPREGTVPAAPIDWTRENILAQARHDLAFAFEKALSKRGISADLMTGVVRMWAWILQTELPTEYAQYGLPVLKAAALAWGFENPIGDDSGSEPQYAAED